MNKSTKRKNRKLQVLAMAAVFYRRHGQYAETYRRIRAAIDPEFFEGWLCEHWIRINLKRMGLGFKGREWKSDLFEVKGWTGVWLPQKVYCRYLSHEFIAHHHPNGTAWEVRFDLGQNECPKCNEPIPRAVFGFLKLRKVGRNAS